MQLTELREQQAALLALKQRALEELKEARAAQVLASLFCLLLFCKVKAFHGQRVKKLFFKWKTLESLTFLQLVHFILTLQFQFFVLW